MNNTENDSQIRESAEMRSDIKYIKKQVQDIKSEMKTGYATKADFTYLEKYTAANINSINKKVDDLEEKINSVLSSITKSVFGAIIGVIGSVVTYLILRQ